MKGTSSNRFKQILSLLLVMAVSAGSMIIAPRINAQTTDAQPEAARITDENTVPAAAVNTVSDTDIDIRSFRSDTQGIPVGESRSVIFSAEISGSVGADDHDVSLLDDADRLIGYMLDNGENGDETADDGIFTLQTVLSSDEEKTVGYHPNAKGIDGDELTIGFYTAADEKAMEQMDTTKEEISDFVKTDSFRQSSDEDKAAAAGTFLDQLAEDGKIKSGSVFYDETTKIYSFEYNTSVKGMLFLEEFNDDTNGAGEINDITDPIDLSNQFTVSEADETPVTNAQNGSVELAETGAGGTYRAIVLNAFENSTYRRSFYQSLQSNWNNKGLNTTVDVDVTIGDLKNLSSYDVVVFAMHGNVARLYSSDPWDPIMSINGAVTTSTARTYEYELSTRHSVAIGTASDGSQSYVVFPKLFTDSYSSSALNGKLIYSESCCFYGSDSKSTSINYNMSNALKNRGASVVVGYHNSVDADYSRDMMKYVIEQTYNGTTVGTAVTNAKRVYGSTDGTSEGAYPVVNPSNSSFVLRSGSTPSYESISLNSTKTASISTAGSMKYYKFTPSSSTQVTFYSSGSYDTLGYLYNANMSQLASDDDSGTDKNFKITYTLSANTTYYLGCKFYSSSRTGSFSVTLSGSSSYESISLNSSKTASISTAGSMKYYKFTPSRSTQIQFYSTGSYDTLGYLYNANMSQLASNDDGGSDKNFKITYTLSANTTYYLGCKFYSSSRTGSFTVKLEEPYETITTGSKAVSISTGGGIKYFKYTPTSTKQIQFYSIGGFDTLGYLYNANMSQLASNDDGGTDHNFKITYTVQANTTYYLGCKFYNSSKTGSFYVTLEDAYESISLNSTKTASIGTAGTMKYYKFTPSSSTQIQFYSTGSYDTLGYLYNANMSQLASNDDGGSDHNFKITYTLSANTTYYFGCKFYSSSRTGSFNVRLESAYESISLNASKTASISSAGSMKYYTYTPSSTTKVEFCSTGSYDTYGYIYNASKSQLASNDDGGDDRNFSITYTLNANTTYIFGCKFYSSSRTGSFTVKLREIEIASDTVSITTAGNTQYYSYTPSAATKVTFYSTGSYDTYGYIYDANANVLASNDDDGDGRNFKITYTLRASTKYYFGCRFYNSSTTGRFNIYFELKNMNECDAAINGDQTNSAEFDLIQPADPQFGMIPESTDVSAEEIEIGGAAEPVSETATETIAQDDEAVEPITENAAEAIDEHPESTAPVMILTK